MIDSNESICSKVLFENMQESSDVLAGFPQFFCDDDGIGRDWNLEEMKKERKHFGSGGGGL